MFTEVLMKRNPEFVQTAVELHRRGQLRPDSYCIDIDALQGNAEAILSEAKKYNLTPYFMLKQLGNNPYIAKLLMDGGWPGAVAVDFKSAQTMINAGIPVCHLGHLVQPPSGMIEGFLKAGVDIITIYSLEKAREIQQCAAKMGISQKLMLRVLGEADTLYPGQYGGAKLDEIGDFVKEISTMPNVEIKGITSFPCFLFDEATQSIQPQPNIQTVRKAAELLQGLGVQLEQINLPSSNCVASMQTAAQNGATHIEPGHSLTGTTPYNAHYPNSAERPALLYLSEISHNLGDKSYLYGGGFYSRGHLGHAYVGSSFDGLEKCTALEFASESIDYCLSLQGNRQIGDTVVMSFRTQIFVTRSDVVLISGISSGKPQIVARYDSSGKSLLW